MSFAPITTNTKVDQDTNAASTTTHAGLTDRRWRLRKVLASYSTATQVGTVTIAGIAGGPDGNTPTTITRDIVGDDKGALDFGEVGIRGCSNTPLVVTMSAGAAAVVSNLTTIAFPE